MADLYMYHFIETLINKALFLRDTKQFLKILHRQLRTHGGVKNKISKRKNREPAKKIDSVN